MSDFRDEGDIFKHPRMEELRRESQQIRKRLREIEKELGKPQTREPVDPANPVSLFLAEDDGGFEN